MTLDIKLVPWSIMISQGKPTCATHFINSAAIFGAMIDLKGTASGNQVV